MILDLFAGPGGWDVNCPGVIGVEHDAAACATRAAAGHLTIRQDVRTIDTARFADLEGLIASPPCPTFSAAGSRAGIGELEHIIDHVHQVKAGWFDYVTTYPGADPRSALVLEPLRFILGCDPAWVALEQVPDVLPVWEAIQHVLRGRGYSVWCGILNSADYGVPQTRRRAILMAARGREVTPPEPTHCEGGGDTLLGRLEPWVSMAEALGWDGFTFGDRDQAHGTIRDAGEPAATIPAAADNGNWRFQVGFPRRADTPSNRAGTDTVEIDGTDYRARDFRDGDQPSFVVTEKARSWTVRTGNNSATEGPGYRNDPEWRNRSKPYERSLDEPAPTVDGKAGSAWTLNTGRDWKPGGTRDDAQCIELDQPAPTVSAIAGGQWSLTRPATTVMAGTDQVWPPGHKVNADDIRRLGEDEAFARYGVRATGREGSIKLTVADALALQSFPRDYPVQGTKTKRFEQVGNAIPPVLAARILAQLL